MAKQKSRELDPATKSYMEGPAFHQSTPHVRPPRIPFTIYTSRRESLSGKWMGRRNK